MAEERVEKTERQAFVAPAEGLRELRIPMDDRARVLVRGTDIGADLDLSYWEIGPSSGTPPHIHHLYDEDFYMLAGELVRQVGDGQQTLRPGSLAVSPRGVPHAFVNPGDEPAVLLTIHTPAGHIQFFEEVHETGAAELEGMEAIMEVCMPIFAKHKVSFVDQPGQPEQDSQSQADVAERNGFYAPPGGIRTLTDPFQDDIRVLLRGEETGSDYDVLHFTMPPGVAVPRHIHHGHDEITYMIEGELTVEVGDERHVITPGMTLLEPRGLPHAFVNSGDGPAKCLVLLTPAGHVAFFEEVHDMDLPPGPPDMEVVGPLAARHQIEIVGPPLEL